MGVEVGAGVGVGAGGVPPAKAKTDKTSVMSMCATIRIYANGRNPTSKANRAG